MQVDKPTGDHAIVQIRDALERKRRVHLRYYVPGRDEATQRDVDPMRLLVVEGRAYLEGWCRRAEGVRLFRLDRILGIDVLDVPAAVPEDAQPVDVDQGLFRPSADDVHVTIEVSAAGRWVAEYYPCESAGELGDGWLRIGLRTPDTRWISAGWRCGWGRTAGSSRRKTSARRSGRTRRPRWPPTPPADGALAACASG